VPDNAYTVSHYQKVNYIPIFRREATFRTADRQSCAILKAVLVFQSFSFIHAAGGSGELAAVQSAVHGGKAFLESGVHLNQHSLNLQFVDCRMVCVLQN